jgi:predicted SprT family Zn-dependent metalloprotease
MAVRGTATAQLKRLRALWRVRLAGVAVVTNPRLRTTLARYRPVDARLELSPTAARSRDLQRVLVHELAHAAAVERHGVRIRPHGKEWRALVEAARRAGLAPEASDGAGPSRRTPATARYAHTCPVCHFSRTAKRRVTTWRCPECRANGLTGLLDIEKRR